MTMSDTKSRGEGRVRGYKITINSINSLVVRGLPIFSPQKATYMQIESIAVVVGQNPREHVILGDIIVRPPGHRVQPHNVLEVGHLAVGPALSRRLLEQQTTQEPCGGHGFAHELSGGETSFSPLHLAQHSATGKQHPQVTPCGYPLAYRRRQRSRRLDHPGPSWSR